MPRLAQPDPASIRFLLEAIETPRLQVSAAALSFGRPAIRETLVRWGCLRAEGYEETAVSQDHQDRMISLVWSEEDQAFGHFGEVTGWIIVDHDQVRRFQIDMDRVLSLLMAKFEFPKSARREMLVADLLWGFGSCRLKGSTKRKPVFFARRLDDAPAVKLIQIALSTHAPDVGVLLLTSTPPDRIPQQFTMASVLSVNGLLSGSFALDPATVAINADRSLPIVPKDRIVLLSEGREVSFFGKIYRFKKGVTQRRIVQYLFDNYQKGVVTVSVERLIADLGLRTKVRIRDIFKKHPAWNEMLFETGGRCGFLVKDE